MPRNVVRREARHLYAAAPGCDEARDAVDALLRLQKAEEGELERVRAASGLSTNEFHATRYLLQAQRDGRDTGPKDLVVMLAISNASVTNIIDRLELLGLLERRAHPGDRRAQLLVPTRTAALRIENAFRAFHETVVAIVDRLDPTEAGIVARVLHEVSEKLERERAE